MKLSVIVCTRNRADSLHRCLDAIDGAAANIDEIEVVVVDNGSTDDTPDLLRRYRETSRRPVRVVEEKTPGLSVARNAGLRASVGALLLCIDDDCLMAPSYIARAVDYDREDGDQLVLRGGNVVLGDPTDLPVTIMTLPHRRRWTLADNDAETYNLGNCLLGCNMMFRRALADRVGPFDERLGAGTNIPGGEDTDLIFRAYLAGCAIEYVPDMTVRHFHGRKLASDGRQLLMNYSIGGGALAAKYWRSNPVLLKQIRWDMKNLAVDTLKRRNSCMPAMEFSFYDKLRYHAVGFMRYRRSAAS